MSDAIEQGTVYQFSSIYDSDERLLIVLGITESGQVDGLVLTPANRVAPIATRSYLDADEVVRWTPLRVEDERTS